MSSRKNLSPYFLWTNQPHKIKNIQTFGCKVIFLIPEQKRCWKLGPLGEEGVLRGFNNESSSYRILKCSNGKVYDSRHFVFFEKEFPMLKIHKESNIPFLTPSWDNSEEEEYFYCQEEIKEQTHEERSLISDEENDSRSDNEHSSLESCLPPAVRQIKVIRPRHPTLINSDITEENILPYSRQPAALLTETDPLTYNKAIKSDNCEYWIKVIKKELQTMIDRNVWGEGAIEDNYELIGTTWVFKVKRDGINNIIEHKERLCAQGFSKTQGKYYSKTFSTACQLNSIRALISHAATNNLKFEQLDRKSAFLNAPLDEDVYLEIPQGFNRDKRNVCLKLKKATYGLKQAPLAWYHRLSSWLVKLGCSISKADSCVFYLKGNEPIWLFLHVDDIGIFAKNLMGFKNAIKCEFQTKLLRSAELMLGIKIVHEPKTITLTQSHYIDSLLESYGMNNCKPTATPLIPNSHLEAGSRTEQEEFLSLKVNYQSAVGSILHWKAFLHVLKYLKGTNNVGLMYKRNIKKPPVAYSDADWGNCRITRRSTTGYLVLLNNNLIIWKTKKQPTMSLSSSKAEYKSLKDLTSELLWLKQLTQEIEILTTMKAIQVYKDNQGCIDTANSYCNTNTQGMKHIDIQLHFFQDVMKEDVIKLVYTPTTNMLADFLTKSIRHPAISTAMKELRLLQMEDKGGVQIRDLSQSVSN
ncbi:hypothetical protein O181_066369 [Austropuccinia psidii MF-1]|uniref:Reverse transcriptase Ty1/copia-type domain-containing protein n=1 Tax=Austropuccinia psidii MF-1 TaxID=1389203 RepID=A0A9Q3ETC8_9BASI|nr:hypothetical protein [Austropuccinia psidii MF-1]